MSQTLSMDLPVGARPRTRVAGGTAFVLLGILLVAANLRAAITSLGALLPEVSAGLSLSPTVAGLITTLPALSFAFFGAFTPRLTRRLSSGQILAGAMLVLAAGQGARVLTDSAVVFVLSSALAMAGIAVANVLLPAMVREYFPHRAGLMTGVYTMTMIIGTSAASASSVPIANAFGSWRAGLAVWAGLAFIAALPWLTSLSRRRAQTVKRPKISVGRTRLGWAMAIYFGAQAISGYAMMGWLAQIFRDATFSPASAGLLLAAVTVFGIPISLLMPSLASRRPDLRVLVVILSAAMILSYLGLMLLPRAGAVLWVALLALGQGAFPLVLTMIGMRARTPDGVVALSAFAQSIGYVIAALGPLLMGVLHEVTGGWHLPIGFLILAAVVQTVAGLAVARPRYLEDETANATT
jgi:CP family cyanate transporter-like MFS transporter